MDSAQFSAVGSIDVLDGAMVVEPDVPQVAETIVFYKVYVAVQIHVECSVCIIAVFVAVGTAIVEVRGTRIGQVLLGMVLNSLQLVAIAGDDEAVYQAVLPLIVHTVSFNAGYVAVLVVGYALGVAVCGIDVGEYGEPGSTMTGICPRGESSSEESISTPVELMIPGCGFKTGRWEYAPSVIIPSYV